LKHHLDVASPLAELTLTELLNLFTSKDDLSGISALE
jgi:hypothetical protein